MKQNICVVIFLLLSTICKAQTFIYPQNDSILTEYNDGKFWAYLNKNDFVVGLSCFEEKDDYGKYYHLDIFIKNLSETPIVFQPDSVHSNLLTKKDDTLKLEVYTNEYSYFALKILRYLETLQFSLSYDVKSRIFHYTFSSG